MRKGARAATTLLLLFAWSTTAQAAEIKAMVSRGLTAAYKALVPEFEHVTGNTVTTVFGPSTGGAEAAIAARLARGEQADVLIMAEPALNDLIKQGAVMGDTRTELARSKIGMVVREGASKPDITTPNALKATLLAAKSVAYSDSASGKYVSTELFDKLGIADAMKDKAKKIEAEPVAAVVARGDAELGLEQISELLPVKGAEYVGPLPRSLQKATMFAAGVTTHAKEPDAARALIKFLAAPIVFPVLIASGVDPADADLK